MDARRGHASYLTKDRSTMTNDQTLTKVFEGYDIRIIQKDGEPWLVAKDVTTALHIRNTSDTTRRLDEDEKGVATIDTPGGPQEVSVINEAGTYRLIFSSRKATAERFKRWLAHEVLPEIRRTGTYSGDGAPSGDLTTLDAVEGMVKALREQQERLDEVEAQQQETTERLDDVEQTLEEHRAAPDGPTTRFGHEAQEHTWEGMRKSINQMVRRRQQRIGGSYEDLYLKLYDACQRHYGFHPKRVQRQQGGPSGIKALDFSQMRALLQVTRWMYEEGHRV